MIQQLDVGKPVWRVTGKCRGVAVTCYVNAPSEEAAGAAARRVGLQSIDSSHPIALDDSLELWPEHLDVCDACREHGSDPCPEGAAAHVRTLAQSMKLPRSPSPT